MHYPMLHATRRNEHHWQVLAQKLSVLRWSKSIYVLLARKGVDVPNIHIQDFIQCPGIITTTVFVWYS